MNINELFEKERWTSLDDYGFHRERADMEDHNESIDRIEHAVREHITELEKTVNMTYVVQSKQSERIAELENKLKNAEENNRFHRANIKKHNDGSFSVCWGDHEKGDDCDYERYYPEKTVDELENKLKYAEQFKREAIQIAELEIKKNIALNIAIRALTQKKI